MKLSEWLKIKVCGINIWPIIKWFRKKKLRTGKLTAIHDPKGRTIKMSKYMTTVPEPPESFSSLDLVAKKVGISDIAKLYPLDGNSKYGNCVVCGDAHTITLSNGRVSEIIIPTEKEVITDYKAQVGCKDSGLVMLKSLKRRRTVPLAGHVFPAFGRVDFKNQKLIKQCIWLFGSVDIGFIVQNDAEDDFNYGDSLETRKIWTSGPSNGGGHCVILCAYDKETVTVLTWGGAIKGTWEWLFSQCDECFVILPKEAFLPGFLEGFKTMDLIADFESVTGETVKMY